MIEIFTIIGSIVGIIAFIWKIYDAIGSYLVIDLCIEKEDKDVFAKVSVNNKSVKRKNIDNALLLIGPEDEDPIDTYNKLFDCNIIRTDEIVDIKYKPLRYHDNRAFIPLDFFYSENIAIGDEYISYRKPIETTNLKPGIYSVRFFIVTKRRAHRSTHSSFKIRAN